MATIEKRVDSTGSITYRVKVRMKGYSQETASFQICRQCVQINGSRFALVPHSTLAQRGT